MALSKTTPIMIPVQGDQSGRCEVVIEGRPYELDANLNAKLRELRSSKRQSVHLFTDVNTPWRCVGSMMTVFAKAGFKRVGFISQPPPESYIKK